MPGTARTFLLSTDECALHVVFVSIHRAVWREGSRLFITKSNYFHSEFVTAPAVVV